MYRYILIALGLVGIQALILYLMGQPALCTCGYIKFWEGVVLSEGNSQHLTDWYTFSHVIHGIIFYALLSLIFPRLPLLARFTLALGVEVGWELLENSPMVIEAYREQALAQGYSGDSIINSVSDTIAMALGFLLARRMPTLFTIALVILLELGVGYLIHDNLTLNVLNFFYHSPTIEAWQSAPY